MKIKLLLTFDHELPLGSLKTNYQKALFDPTDKLFEMAGKCGVPVTLFTDILCDLRYRQWDHDGFHVPYSRQLQQALALGHDVQLHLHPHWLTSQFSNGRVLPSEDYSLAHFATGKEIALEQIIENGISGLKEICSNILPDYSPVAFRAGGYNIEPASSAIFSGLKNKGILYDSSVVLGYYFASALSVVDFRRLPDIPNWKIGNDGNFRVAAKEGITEIPVAAIPKTPFEIPTRFKLKKYAFRAPENHGATLHEGKAAGWMNRLRMLFSSRVLTFDNHTYSPQYLMKILDFNVNRFSESEEIILASCSHPKTMGDYSFRLMETFIDNARKKYRELEFTTFSGLPISS